ncbi:MAG: hypothetical protein Fur005_38340 [Roseiflexaceae bacterium]
MLSNPYALRIMVLIAISNWSFSLLDLTFADQVEQSFRDSATLVACGYYAPREQHHLLRQQIRSEAEQAATLIAITAEFEPTDLLSDALASDIERCQQRMLDLLALIGNSRILAIARDHFKQSSSTRRAAAIEILDVLLPTELRGVVLPLFEAIDPASQLPRLRAAFAIPQQSSISWLLALTEPTHLPLSQWSRTRALANALARQIIPATAESQTALAMVERVAALRRVNLFAQTPGEILAEIADRLDRIQLPGGTTIFQEGDAGTAMYLLTVGRVRIEANWQAIATISAGEGFSEMAVLDPAPRSATAETLEPTELLQLQRADLDALFDERPEIVHSLIRTLTRNLRQSVAELATLRTLQSSAS